LVGAKNEEEKMADIDDKYCCDYLVVGAGTAGMSFIDTMLTENPTATIILVDRNEGPGGHWTKAYPFVKLHQPSFGYGVNSEPLGKYFDKKGNEIVKTNEDRATGSEIVDYYNKLLKKFQNSSGHGRFKAFFNSYYKGEEKSSKNHGSDDDFAIHSIEPSNGTLISIRCHKLVMIRTNVIVPKMRPAPFPVHEDVNYIPVNDLPKEKSTGNYTHFVILGAGKTSLDAVIELLRSGVDQSKIKWIISQDVWFFIRDTTQVTKHHYRVGNEFLKPMAREKTAKDLFLQWEAAGLIGRLLGSTTTLPPASVKSLFKTTKVLSTENDKAFPDIFKGPCIDLKELLLVRTVNDIVRLGRVSSIESGGTMMFGTKDDNNNNTRRQTPNKVQLSSPNESTLFVDCMAENFLGYTAFPKDMKIFEPNKINLGPIFVLFNPSLCSAIIAYMESRIQDKDEAKNSCLYFTTSLEKHSYSVFILQFYLNIKTYTALGKTYPHVMDFVLKSRTNLDSPAHHGGMLPFLWSQLGPMQLLRKAKIFVKIVEEGKMQGIHIDDDYIQRTLPAPIKVSRKEKAAVKKANLKNPYPPTLTKHKN